MTMQTADFNAAFMDKMGVIPLLECLYSHVCALFTIIHTQGTPKAIQHDTTQLT